MEDITTSSVPVRFANFGRIGKVELLKDGEVISDIHTEGLDFKFRTSQLFLPDASPATASVGILGLSKSSVDYLCEFCDQSAYMKRNISVRVWAGYETDSRGMQQVLHMPVFSAIPSMPPDNWVTLNCVMSVIEERLLSYSFTWDAAKDKKPRSAYDIINYLGEAFKISWRWHKGAQEAAEKFNVEFFGCNGGALEAVEAVRSKFKFLRVIQVPGAFHKDTHQPTVYDLWKSRFYERDSEGKYKWTEEFGTHHSWEIDKDHGMIGLPSFIPSPSNHKKVTARVLLNPSIQHGDLVKLKSLVASGLNGVYRVYTVRHTGHLRGNEWYTDIEMYEDTSA